MWCWRQPDWAVTGSLQRQITLAVVCGTPLLTCAVESEVPVHVTCNADLLCVEVYKDTQVRLILDNVTAKPLSFRLFVIGDHLEEAQPVIYLDGPVRQTLMSFPNSGKPWGFEYRIHYGHESHVHDDGYLYTLPFAPGAGYQVSQSHTNITTHHLGNRFAVDFSMPVGERIHAARGGVVVSTYAESTTQSVNGDAAANHIWIEHSDGTIGKYLHLDRNGVLVSEGDRVEDGDEIGISGNTGFSRGAHLHFSVSTLGGDALYQTFNVRFITESGPVQLISGVQYRRPSRILEDPMTTAVSGNGTFRSGGMP